jgi:hypothetical protein
LHRGDSTFVSQGGSKPDDVLVEPRGNKEGRHGEHQGDADGARGAAVAEWRSVWNAQAEGCDFQVGRVPGKES